jgi:hypothetical protein
MRRAIQWNDRYGAGSGPSRVDFCRRAFRPTEASKAAVRYVRLTSIRDVAQTSQMPKERSFPDGVA